VLSFKNGKGMSAQSFAGNTASPRPTQEKIALLLNIPPVMATTLMLCLSFISVVNSA